MTIHQKKAVALTADHGMNAKSAAVEFLFSRDGIPEVLTREQAVDKLEFAPDRIGDLVVLSGRDRLGNLGRQCHAGGQLTAWNVARRVS